MYWDFNNHTLKDCLPMPLTSIAGLVHVNDLDLTTQILVSPCHTCPVYILNRSNMEKKNLGRKVEVKYMNEPFNAC